MEKSFGSGNYPKKSYVMMKKFGANRNFIPAFEDANPMKYGGKYGL